MVTKKLNFLDSSWYHYLALSTITFAVVTGLFRFTILDRHDPIHCNTLVTKGSWLDVPHRNWQPEGCMLHSYQPKDISHCLASRRVVFIGDSVARKLYFEFVHLVDHKLPNAPPDDEQKHSDHSFISVSQTKLDFVWDPFLNSSTTVALTSSSKQHSADPRTSERPALLAFGSGLWYLRYADASGGLPAWEANIETIIKAISEVYDKLADQVIFLPVEEVVPSKLTQERLDTMHSSDIDAMNADLYQRIKPSPFFDTIPAVPLSLPLVFNKMLDDSQTEDGLHFVDSVVRAQANILLNLRCNNEWPKTFPMDKTCCRSYPWPSPMHLVVIAGIALFTFLALCRSYLESPKQGWVTNKEYLPMVVFGAAIWMIYVADRTGLWLKEHKSFNPWTFAFLSLTSLGIGLATIHRADKDLGFLNRDQTDEWKGWMQVAILIYHYLGASKISGIYNPIRVLVAAYLFMTGYGHTTFYMKKADFGFLRIAQVMVRLNLLTLALAYTMNTDYLSYYFAPLVSMWFLIIYATMAIGSRLNDNTPFLVAKILLSMGLFAAFMQEAWLLEAFFQVLERIFFIHWSAREWTFRVTLDQYVVYFGMLAALAVIKIREHHLTDHPRWPMFVKAWTAGSTLVLFWFMGFELMQESKFTYNGWHPYISFLPIGAFVVLRNASPLLRSCSSRAFAFIGKCSLETFVIQYHLWLAGDTKGILLLVPGTRWRPVNFMVSTFVFIYVSHQVAWATGKMTAWICDTDESLPLSARRGGPGSGQNDASGASSTLETVPLVTGNEDHSNAAEDGHRPEPDTPIRVPPWIHRLSEGTTQRRAPALRIWHSESWKHRMLGVEGKIGVAVVCMWLANALWTDP
ncbi:10 TM acyl transferase domain found in Cas1p-domain-containing protein [Phlebopus sp. FC_14]|nr:10 TM acyl transferase domain found in Cas1p-domain-containing protein [Phlebopus sp. FC_14]